MNQQTASPPECRLRVEARADGIVVWPDGGECPPDAWFDPSALAARGATAAAGTGRAATLRFDWGGRALVLRHFRRGGLVRHLTDDRYLRVGLRNSRPWRELALLTRLHAGGMPVPAPAAARIAPLGAMSPWYRGDLVTGFLDGTQTLTERLRHGGADAVPWPEIGATIARFHCVGVDHVDLNAHNVLLDGDDRVYLIDFDRARLRWSGRWSRRNLNRLRRSLAKIARAEPSIAYSEGGWHRLMAGYRSA